MFMTQSSFQEAIEGKVKFKRLTYMESVIEFCKENDIDLEDIGSLVSSNLRDKIRQDAMNNGFMKKTAVLPI